MLLKRFSILPSNAHITLNNLILYVCLPATSLIYASTIDFRPQYFLVILMPWILFIGSFIFFRSLRQFANIHRHSEAVLILTSGIPSISFVGFPIFQILYGEEGLQLGVLMSQAGSFLVCSTLGVITASVYSNQGREKALRPLPLQILIDVLTFPTFIAFAVAISMNIIGLSFSLWATEILKKLSSPFTFVALISVGLQIELNPKALQKSNLKWGLMYKLLLCPLIIFLLYHVGLRETDIASKVSILGAAIGSMNMTAVLALRYGLNPTLAAQMVGISIPLSLLIVYAIQAVL
jgi:malate permease and related proteins